MSLFNIFSWSLKVFLLGNRLCLFLGSLVLSCFLTLLLAFLLEFSLNLCLDWLFLNLLGGLLTSSLFCLSVINRSLFSVLIILNLSIFNTLFSWLFTSLRLCILILSKRFVSYLINSWWWWVLFNFLFINSLFLSSNWLLWSVLNCLSFILNNMFRLRSILLLIGLNILMDLITILMILMLNFFSHFLLSILIMGLLSLFLLLFLMLLFLTMRLLTLFTFGLLISTWRISTRLRLRFANFLFFLIRLKFLIRIQNLFDFF